MTGDQRIGGNAPIVIEHGEITVTDATALDGDFNLLVPKGAGRVFISLKRLFGGGRGEGVDGGFVAEGEQEIGGVERVAREGLGAASEPGTEGEGIKATLDMQSVERGVGDVFELLSDGALTAFAAADDGDPGGERLRFAGGRTGP